MKKILLLLLLFVSAVSAQQPAAKKPDLALAPITDQAALPRVLLIGDSISIGYTIPTRELLKGKANVHRIPTNGGSTKNGVESIDKWLGTGKWDIIHFNWGLHDLKHWKDGKLDMAGPQVSTLDEYEKNLRTLVKRLKATGAKLIFATTTPVPEGSGGRTLGDDLPYNAVAVRIMKEEGVSINDLNAYCRPKLPELQLPKNVHFSPAGSKALAERVAKEIEAALKK